MKPSSKKSIFTIAAAILAVVTLFIYAVVRLQSSGNTTLATDKLEVVASTNVWGDIASQIGGNNVQVTSILSDPEADPHLFESDARTASQIGAAQLVIVNGLGYDEFMDKLLAAAPNNNQQVITVAEVLSASAKDNPHLWYDLPRVQAVAIAIQDKLIKLDPANAAEYKQNTQKFNGELQSVVDNITKKSAGIAYTERVAEYLVKDLGLTDKTPLGFSNSVENGTEPSPQQVQEFENVLKSGAVKILLYNSQAVSEVTEQLQATAERAGVAVIPVSETLPEGKNFQTWQLDQLSAILKAL